MSCYENTNLLYQNVVEARKVTAVKKGVPSEEVGSSHLSHKLALKPHFGLSEIIACDAPLLPQTKIQL